MDFFLLENAFSRRSLHLDVLDKEIDQDVAVRILRNELVWPTSIRFSPQDKVFRTVDLVGSTLVNLELISQKFKDVLESNAMTGWITYPVSILDREGNQISDYYGLAITGRCGPVLWDESERVILPRPVPQGRESEGWRGLPFDENTWDGSDLFVPGNSNFVIASPRAKAILEKSRLSNVSFTNTKLLERSWNEDKDGKVVFGRII
jgi:hypothetical protein